MPWTYIHLANREKAWNAVPLALSKYCSFFKDQLNPSAGTWKELGVLSLSNHIVSVTLLDYFHQRLRIPQD